MLRVTRRGGRRSAVGLSTGFGCPFLCLRTVISRVDEKLRRRRTRRRSVAVAQSPWLVADRILQRYEPPLYVWIRPVCLPGLLNRLPLRWKARLYSGAWCASACSRHDERADKNALVKSSVRAEIQHTSLVTDFTHGPIELS